MHALLRGCVLVTSILSLFGSAQAFGTTEENTDRPGSDFTSVMLPSNNDPTDCGRLCEHQEQCVAWTFVKAGGQAPNPRCWLKESIPAAKPDDCCTSGLVRRDISLEPNTNRVGGDYTSLNITNDIAYCRQLCDADEPCVAWTFVHPGVQGPQARCWLKKTIIRREQASVATPEPWPFGRHSHSRDNRHARATGRWRLRPGPFCPATYHLGYCQCVWTGPPCALAGRWNSQPALDETANRSFRCRSRTLTKALRLIPESEEV